MISVKGVGRDSETQLQVQVCKILRFKDYKFCPILANTI